MTCPGSYPTVLNGQISSSDNNTAEYECLTGFYMSGTKRITCSSGVWQTSPTCSVIRQYDEYNVFPDWWFYVLGIILGLLVLACFLCLLLYFCCCRGGASGGGGGGGCGGGVCSCCCRQRRTGVWEDGVIRVSPQPHGQSNGVYFVPVSQVIDKFQGGHLATNDHRTTNNRSSGTDRDKEQKKRTRTTATNTEDDYDPSDYYPINGYYVYGAPRTFDSYAWTEQGGPRTSHQTWTDSSDLLEDDLIANQRRPTKNRATNTEKDGGKKKTTATNTDNNGEHDTSDYKTSSYVYGTPRSYDGYAWSDQRGLQAPKAWKESSNLETRSDGDLKGSKPAKEVKLWMPHSKPMRNNNTSTK